MTAVAMAGMALAVMGGIWTAEIVLLWETLRLFREMAGRRGDGAPRGRPGKADGAGAARQDETAAGLAGERDGGAPSDEEALRSAAVQEGFDNLMRYTVGTARGKEGNMR